MKIKALIAIFIMSYCNSITPMEVELQKVPEGTLVTEAGIIRSGKEYPKA